MKTLQIELLEGFWAAICVTEKDRGSGLMALTYFTEPYLCKGKIYIKAER